VTSVVYWPEFLATDLEARVRFPALPEKSSGSCLENREYGHRDPSRWPRGTLYSQKLAITSPTSGGRSVGKVRLRTQTMEFFSSSSSSSSSSSGSSSNLCGLVDRVPGYRSRGPGSIPDATKKKSSGSGTGSTQPREYNWGATW
jgi:hypothetical protein